MAASLPTYKVVAYRTGGWMNAQWHRTTATLDGSETRQRVEEIERGGRKTRVFDLKELEVIGLPVGFCPHANSETGHMAVKKCKCV